MVDLCIAYFVVCEFVFFFFSSRRRHTRSDRDWSSDVCSSDLYVPEDFTWPRHVERGLAKERGTPAWVGNFGKSGRNSRQHVLDAKYVLPQFSAQIGRASCRERV